MAGIVVGAGERLTALCLRESMVTTAYAAGARDQEIMAHTRHADYRTMRAYVRRAKLLTDSPAKELGL